VVAALALLVGEGSASAAEPRHDEVLREGRIPGLPAPFALPELTHSRLDLRMDWLVAHEVARDPSRARAVGAIARPSVEGRLRTTPALFLGLTWPIAAALPPDGGLARGEAAPASGSRALLGNVEGHVRAVFTLPTWLEMGFTLGLVAPSASFERSDRGARSAEAAAVSLDPTSFPQFLPGHFAFRPAGDLRVVRGPFVFQGRHGLDVVIDDQAIEDAKVSGRLVGHVGWLARRDLEVSLEASQTYAFGTDPPDAGGGSPADRAFRAAYRTSDAHRAAIVFGPGVRYATPEVDVGVALVANAGAPYSPVVGEVIGLRFSVVGHLCPRD
jgi:hypothetical protein